MSKTSSKQRYVQLKEWLETRNRGRVSSSSSPRTSKFSKLDHYKNSNSRNGNKNNN